MPRWVPSRLSDRSPRVANATGFRLNLGVNFPPARQSNTFLAAMELIGTSPPIKKKNRSASLLCVVATFRYVALSAVLLQMDVLHPVVIRTEFRPMQSRGQWDESTPFAVTFVVAYQQIPLLSGQTRGSEHQNVSWAPAWRAESCPCLPSA